MTRRGFLLIALTTSPLLTAAAAAPEPPKAAGAWKATGTLLESCTCAVPCTCNFGQGPSPHSYCHAIFGYRLDQAVWDGIDLSGLAVAGADGPRGNIGFLDDRATAAQRPALEKMARVIFAQGGPADGPRKWISAPIVHEVSGNRLHLAIGQRGGFQADVLIGRDGKTPIVVENNAVWPVKRATKAKAARLHYADTDGAGTIDATDNNANYGMFEFSGRTTAP